MLDSTGNSAPVARVAILAILCYNSGGVATRSLLVPTTGCPTDGCNTGKPLSPCCMSAVSLHFGAVVAARCGCFTSNTARSVRQVWAEHPLLVPLMRYLYYRYAFSFGSGLGKTTLAHVVARHCGYHPYEINASDDRTAATLATKIQDAVQMTAVLGGGRPNCVIVDEIDGATGGTETGGAVAALLKLVRAGEGVAGGKGGGGNKGKRRWGETKEQGHVAKCIAC